jgi:hypothetical protein
MKQFNTDQLIFTLIVGGVILCVIIYRSFFTY